MLYFWYTTPNQHTDTQLRTFNKPALLRGESNKVNRHCERARLDCKRAIHTDAQYLMCDIRSCKVHGNLFLLEEIDMIITIKQLKALSYFDCLQKSILLLYLMFKRPIRRCITYFKNNNQPSSTCFHLLFSTRHSRSLRDRKA